MIWIPLFGAARDGSGSVLDNLRQRERDQGIKGARDRIAKARARARVQVKGPAVKRISHLLALSLMGWYLMVPPTVGPYLRLDSSAPDSRWHIIQSFDTATACEGYLQEMKEGPGALHGEYSVAPKFETEGLKKMQDKGITTSALTAARCIFSDDPRLKP